MAAAEKTVIRDAIHGDIELDGGVLSILDEPAMQRLRYVRQWATTYLVFPSARHSRFEHSLGTYCLTRMLCGRLIADADEAAHVSIAGLLHDAGHPAFSHLSEVVVHGLTGKDHEQLGIDIVSSQPLSAALEKRGYSVSKIVSILSGKDRHHALIGGDLGTDRMDYLLRDAYFCGVNYSTVDASRLINTLKLSAGELVVPAKGLRAAESLLVSRHLMMSSVYYHHAVRIASKMLRKAIRISMEDGGLTVGDLCNGTDDHLLFSMAKSGSRLARMLTQRRLFKRALSKPLSVPKASWQRESEKVARELEGEFGEESVVVCSPVIHSSGVSLHTDAFGKSESLAEASGLVKALTASESAPELIVACEPALMEKVAKAAARLI